MRYDCRPKERSGRGPRLVRLAHGKHQLRPAHLGAPQICLLDSRELQTGCEDESASGD